VFGIVLHALAELVDDASDAASAQIALERVGGAPVRALRTQVRQLAGVEGVNVGR
jgi:hypothetical protein